MKYPTSKFVFINLTKTSCTALFTSLMSFHELWVFTLTVVGLNSFSYFKRNSLRKNNTTNSFNFKIKQFLSIKNIFKKIESKTKNTNFYLIGKFFNILADSPCFKQLLQVYPASFISNVGPDETTHRYLEAFCP